MADRTRACRWAANPLGPIQSWPEPLLTTANLILSTPVPAVIFWGRQMIQLYNDAYLPLMTDKHPAALGQPARECWKEAWHLIGPQLEAVLHHGQSIHQQNTVVPVLRNGRLEDIVWNYTYSPIFMPDGAVAGILVLCQDVTSEARTVQALRQSEERLRMALQASNGVGTWDWDVPADRAYADPGFARLYGVDPAAAAAGAPIATFTQNIHPEDAEAVAASIAEALANGGPYSSEYRLLQPDGSIRWVAAVGRCTLSPTGDPLRFPGVVLDITGRKRTEAALLQSEKLAAVGRLASSIAHEINNPLEAVMNLIYLARGYAILPEVQQLLDVADRELRRVAQIANQTLRFHKQSTSPRAVDPHDLFDSLLTVYEGRLRNGGLSIERRERATHSILCFEGEIRQVLSNLFANAIDAMPTGGRLLLRSRDSAHHPTGRRGLRLTIADTGQGIPPATVAKLFEPFFTTKGFAGTGLGLWVSREIVDRHHGQLHLRSSQHPTRSGTVFTLFLPFDAATRYPARDSTAKQRILN